MGSGDSWRPLSAGSLFPGGSVSSPCSPVPGCLYCVSLYCMEIKVYKHVVLSQQGRVWGPLPAAAQFLLTQSQPIRQQAQRGRGVHRQEQRPSITMPQPACPQPQAPHFDSWPPVPSKMPPLPIAGASPLAQEGPETTRLLAVASWPLGEGSGWQQRAHGVCSACPVRPWGEVSLGHPHCRPPSKGA